MKNAIAVQQEKLLEEKGLSMESMNKEMLLAKEKSAKLGQENEQQQKKISELLSSIEESKKVIEDNNHGKFVCLNQKLSTGSTNN